VQTVDVEEPTCGVPVQPDFDDFGAGLLAVAELEPVRLPQPQVGGDTVDYTSDSSVPAVLSPGLGTDLSGQCWYLTSASTDYIILNQFADGSAEIGLETDPGNPGGIIALGPTVPRCTSEPASAADPAGEAWDYAIA
jgi:hypothetical protein